MSRLRERYQDELQELTEVQAQKIEVETAEREIESYCKKIKENLTSLDHDGKRSAFAVLNVSAVATHDQVVVKGIVPSDITTIERTSGCMYSERLALNSLPMNYVFFERPLHSTSGPQPHAITG